MTTRASLLPRAFSCLSFALVATTCGGSSQQGPATQPGAHPATITSATSPIAGSRVFDAHGHGQACEAPRKNCPQETPNTEFTDRCKLAGFRVLLCGCENVCSGDVTAAGRYFDAAGHPKECEQARADCAVAEASTAFQDACSERAHRLRQCGCEWLCSGDPTK